MGEAVNTVITRRKITVVKEEQNFAKPETNDTPPRLRHVLSLDVAIPSTREQRKFAEVVFNITKFQKF